MDAGPNPRFEKAYRRMLRRSPRDMPAGFEPDSVIDDGQKVVARHAAPDGTDLEIGFPVSTNAETNARRHRDMVFAIWQSSEIWRLRAEGVHI